MGIFFYFDFCLSDEENEDEQAIGGGGEGGRVGGTFSDDELEDNQALKDRRASRSGTITAMSQRHQLTCSKLSLAESSLHNSGGHGGTGTNTFGSTVSSDESSASDDEDESGSEESLGDDNLGLPEILAKRGFDYESLFGASLTRKLENGTTQRLKSPLIESLFAHVPPVLRFVTVEDKSNNKHF